MNSDTWMQRADTVITRTYARFKRVLVKGQGCTVWDADGRSYHDFVAGIAVCNLGHAHPAITRAVTEQVQTLLHVSNLYYTTPQIELAERLTRSSFAERVFFCNSGAEANEAAIKLSRKYFHDRGQPQRHCILAAEQSFHGRTMGALAATGQDKIKTGFAPLLPGFEFVPFNDLPALEARLNELQESVCAVLLEPLQGEGGVIQPDAGYLAGVRRLCDQIGCLLIFDEIQTGIGRTGQLFAYQHTPIQPDIMTLAKALANGLPIGALLATDTVAEAFSAGAHASTFGGTPLVTAAATAVLDTIEQENLLGHGRRVGDYFKTELQQLQSRHACIREVRGQGLLLGLALDREAAPLVNACLERGFLINAVQGTVLRFVPPLIIDTPAIDALIACLDDLLGEPS